MSSREKRSARCRTCGATIRVRAKNMSIGAAMRKHYWSYHPELIVRPSRRGVR